MRRLFVLLAVACVGCVSHLEPRPTAGEAAREVGAVLCPHLQGCYPTHYAAIYPDDVDGRYDGCTAALLASVPDEHASDSCDRATLDVCLSDLRALPCADRPRDESMPATCRGC